MAEPFLSEIRIMSFVFAPKGWALCNGQLLPINQNQGLFSLLGTTFGGDGRVNFALPDLRGRAPIHMGPQTTLGQRGGQEAHTATIAEMPAHNHSWNASSANGDSVSPAGTLMGAVNNTYTGFANLTTLAPGSISNVGGSQPHENMQPFIVLNFVMALVGAFPSQN